MSKKKQNYTVKIPVFKIKTRNEIFHFFTFCSVLKIDKFFFDIIILLTNVFMDIRRSSSCQKKFQTIYKEIVDNKFILVAYVGQGQNWGQKGPQNSEIWNSNPNIAGRISAIGQHWSGSRSSLPFSIFQTNIFFLG